MVKNNVPYDVAFSMDDVTRAAHTIVIRNFDLPPEKQFCFESMAFPPD